MDDHTLSIFLLKSLDAVLQYLDSCHMVMQPRLTTGSYAFDKLSCQSALRR